MSKMPADILGMFFGLGMEIDWRPQFSLTHLWIGCELIVKLILGSIRGRMVEVCFIAIAKAVRTNFGRGEWHSPGFRSIGLS